MERKVIWTILIGIILFGAVFFICIDRLPHSSQINQNSAPIPKYKMGDIVGNETIKNQPLLLILINEKIRLDTSEIIILDYNNQTDEYLVNLIFKNIDGNWRRLYPDVIWTERQSIEDFNPILNTHIDVSKLVTLYSSKDDMNAAIDAAWAAGDNVGYYTLDNVITPTPTPAITFTTKPTPTPKPTCSSPASVYPSYIGDSGNNVVSIKVPSDGLRIFTFLYTGKGNFIVKLTDESGDTVDLLVNEIGSYSGRKSEKLYAGKYYLDIIGSGTYSIAILDAWCV